MRPRLLGSTVLGVLALVLTGCPDDPVPDTVDSARHDSGTCVAVDVGPSAPDGDEPTDADDASDVGDTSVSDATDVGADATDVSDASDATDVAAESTVDATLDATDSKSDAADGTTGVDADASDTSFDTALREFDAGPPVARSAVDAIINLSCTFNSCHGRAIGVGGLVLFKTGVGDWYPNLVGVASIENPDMPYVDPGNPSNSWLAHKIVGDQCLYTSKCKDHDCGDQMPAANDPLDDDDIRTILDWIRQGAKPK